MTEIERQELDFLRKRVALLSDVVEDIAHIADGHRRSTLQDDDGNNVALSVILGRAASALGMDERLISNGTVFATSGAKVF
ncbi:hypothetical protein G6L37_02405 [Agrobacterium rubi]|nr:hypothetical protein [Agrobacterium rubi]NTF24247.1 hypothetical protein [Agrobacterium rubi]